MQTVRRFSHVLYSLSQSKLDTSLHNIYDPPDIKGFSAFEIYCRVHELKTNSNIFVCVA